MNWAAEELRDIALGSERRNKRAVRLLERLSAQPTAGLPQACRGQVTKARGQSAAHS